MPWRAHFIYVTSRDKTASLEPMDGEQLNTRLSALPSQVSACMLATWPATWTSVAPRTRVRRISTSHAFGNLTLRVLLFNAAPEILLLSRCVRRDTHSTCSVLLSSSVLPPNLIPRAAAVLLQHDSLIVMGENAATSLTAKSIHTPRHCAISSNGNPCTRDPVLIKECGSVIAPRRVSLSPASRGRRAISCDSWQRLQSALTHRGWRRFYAERIFTVTCQADAFVNIYFHLLPTASLPPSPIDSFRAIRDGLVRCRCIGSSSLLHTVINV